MDTLQSIDGDFDALFCNPPFFENEFDGANSKNNRVKTNPSCQNESVCDGGEVKFIEKLINESLIVKTKVKIYSTMLGKKKSVLHLTKILKDLKNSSSISSYSTTEFCQGNKMRWGLAWTFLEDVKIEKTSLRLEHGLKKQKTLILKIDKSHVPDIRKLMGNVVDIFKSLYFQVETNISTEKSMEFSIKSNCNTWSHQRRKKREMKRVEHVEKVFNEEMETETETKCPILPVANIHLKRKLDDSNTDDEMELEDSEPQNSKKFKEKESKDEEYLLNCNFEISEYETGFQIKLTEMASSNNQSINEVFQYFKNILTKKCDS